MINKCDQAIHSALGFLVEGSKLCSRILNRGFTHIREGDIIFIKDSIDKAVNNLNYLNKFGTDIKDVIKKRER